MTTNRFSKIARLENRINHNEKYMQLHFSLAEPFSQPFLAGQYVSIKIGERQDLRSYSICSSPTSLDGFDLLIDVTPHGIGTTFLQNLAIGAEIEVLAPLGKFVLKNDVLDRPIVLIGTGSGVAPLMSMCHQFLENMHGTHLLQLLWGERFSKDFIWLDTLNKLQQEHSNFKFLPTVSRPVEGETFPQGRVTDVLNSLQLIPSTNYYLCGNRSMIEDVSKFLLGRGVWESEIFYEKFY